MPLSDGGSTLVGRRYLTGNYGIVSVYKDADLADPHRVVGLVVLGSLAGMRLGIPQHELGTKFPEVGR